MRISFIVIIAIFISSCNTNTRGLNHDRPITNVVGEIFHDSLIDSSVFKICQAQDQIVQYYAFNEKTHQNEKDSLVDYFKTAYKSHEDNQQSGLIRIRFIVNCRGEAGRFRLLSMNKQYQEKVFPEIITLQLLTLTKNFNGWKAMQAKEEYRDYYQYLIFKIENGKLIEIMP